MGDSPKHLSDLKELGAIFWAIRPSADYLTVPYFTTPMSLTVGRIRSASATVATRLNTATNSNRVGSDMRLDRVTALPAIQFPMLIERNQMPIMKPAARSGAS